jgi:hypothetical protein
MFLLPLPSSYQHLESRVLSSAASCLRKLNACCNVARNVLKRGAVLIFFCPRRYPRSLKLISSATSVKGIDTSITESRNLFSAAERAVQVQTTKYGVFWN